MGCSVEGESDLRCIIQLGSCDGVFFVSVSYFIF